MYSRPIFSPNLEVDQTNYYWFETGFSDEEIEKILKTTKDYSFEAGTIISNNPKDVRNSSIKWMEPNEKTDWIYNRLMNCIVEANNTWKFNIHSVLDDIQYTEYRGGGGHYDWHMDIGGGSISHRKISVIVQLSDPSEYTGGELEINTGSNVVKVSNKKGSIILFPSFIQHRVTPVSSGLRKSLVLWAGGDHYK
jgi:PKHD-type hydroxylase